MIDIVFVANSKNSFLKQMTSNAIRTARDRAGTDIGSVVVVEQCRYTMEHKNAKTLYYDFEFNYNKCLNLGFYVCRSEYVAFCNNDLFFEKNWAKNIIHEMLKGGYKSASPTPKHQFNGVKEGYKIGKIVLGWCIVAHRSVIEQIGGFATPVEFWYSDNVYAEQLKKHNIKHILVGTSYVKHLTSITLRKIGQQTRKKYQKEQEVKFNNWKNVYTST